MTAPESNCGHPHNPFAFEFMARVAGMKPPAPVRYVEVMPNDQMAVVGSVCRVVEEGDKGVVIELMEGIKRFLPSGQYRDTGHPHDLTRELRAAHILIANASEKITSLVDAMNLNPLVLGKNSTLILQHRDALNRMNDELIAADDSYEAKYGNKAAGR